MIITDQKIYDGMFIHQKFAYNYFRDKVSPSGNIVAFIAPAKVEASGMIDKEDILNKDYIYSEKMINFCWEIPCIYNSFGAVTFQRLFNTGIAHILSKLIGKPISVEGDDIMVVDNGKEGKASVSITHMVGECAIGHTGINIIAGEQAPSHAYSTNLDDNSAINFINEVDNYFNWLVKDIFVASTKTI